MTAIAPENLLDSKDATRNVKLKYGGFYKVVAREEAGTKIKLEYDTEDRLTAVVNEAGEKYTFELDARGLVKRETTFDGIERWYERDKAGRVTVEHLSRGRENAMGRLTQIAWWDGKKFDIPRSSRNEPKYCSR